MDYVIFSLNNELFGAPVTCVKEILKAPVLHSLPQAPDFIAGIMSVRNHGIAVMDLKKRYQPSLISQQSDAHVMIVSIDGFVLGLLIDRAMDVRFFQTHQIENSLRLLGPAWMSPALTGLVHDGNQIVFILDLKALLDTHEKQALQKLTHG